MVLLLGFGIHSAHHTATPCQRSLQNPLLIVGGVIAGLSLLGFAGSCFKSNLFLKPYLFLTFLVIVGLIGFTIFAFLVTNANAGKAVSGKGYKQYRLGDYTHWLQNHFVNAKHWSAIKSCLVEAQVCKALVDEKMPKVDFLNKNFSPLQSGCCQPPSECGFEYQNATFWAVPKSGPVSNEIDCTRWSNDQDKLCYNCNSCKAGFLASIRKQWRVSAIVLICITIFIVVVFSIALLAKRNNQEGDYTSTYLHLHQGTQCQKALQNPLLIIGIILFLIALLGLIGSCLNVPCVLLIYSCVTFFMVIGLTVFTLFAYLVTNMGAARSIKGLGFREYRLGDYSTWLRNHFVNGENWDEIRSCLIDAGVCQSLGVANVDQKVADFYKRKLSPIQYVNATFWIMPKSGPAVPETDCTTWSNEQDKLCYDCNSCKGGVLANIRKDWRLLTTINFCFLLFIEEPFISSQSEVQTKKKWDKITTCLIRHSICKEIDGHGVKRAQDFYQKNLPPLEFGCCSPPKDCGFKFKNATFWTAPESAGLPFTDGDCSLWSNDQKELCYNCRGHGKYSLYLTALTLSSSLLSSPSAVTISGRDFKPVRNSAVEDRGLGASMDLFLSGVLYFSWASNFHHHSNVVQNRMKWDRIKTCFIDHQLCKHIKGVKNAQEFYDKGLSSLEYGCCSPPVRCGFEFKNATYWIEPESGAASTDSDCKKWRNDQNELCYDCKSCKAGVVEMSSLTWRIFAILDAIDIFIIIVILALSCFIREQFQVETITSYIMVRPSNIILAIFNWITLVIGLGAMATGLYFVVTDTDTACQNGLEDPLFIVGASLTVISLLGLIGACFGANFFLVIYLGVLFCAIVGLICFTIFTILVTNASAGKMFSNSKAFNFQNWLKNHFVDNKNWVEVKSCLMDANVCTNPSGPKTLDFYRDHLTSIQVVAGHQFLVALYSRTQHPGHAQREARRPQTRTATPGAIRWIKCATIARFARLDLLTVSGSSG
ncbi:hypothetical protein Tsubulata_029691, partial [Turnera subulata]